MKYCLRLYNSSLGIIVGALLGIICGYLFPHYVVFFKPLGDIFISLIKMMLAPIILVTLIYSIASLGKVNKSFRIAVFAIFYFTLMSFLAGTLGIIFANFFHPGLGLGELPKSFFSETEALKYQSNAVPLSFWSFIINIIPPNPFKSLSEGNIMQIIFYAVFVGLGISYVNNKYKDIFLQNFSVLNDVVLWIIAKIMFLAPIAVFSLMSYWVASVGLHILVLVGKLFIVVLFAGFVWIYGVLGLVVILFSKVRYGEFLKKIIPVQLISLSTSSSLVSLPVNIKACETMKLDSALYSFMLPLGANLHMNGSAIYYCSITIFFAQMFNVPLDISTYILIALMATIGSMATPGIPGLSLVVIMVLMVANVPLIGIPLIFAIDRVLDMFVTTINVVGNTTAVAVADKYLSDK